MWLLRRIHGQVLRIVKEQKGRIRKNGEINLKTIAVTRLVCSINPWDNNQFSYFRNMIVRSGGIPVYQSLKLFYC
jgi:hypothetical protein